MDDNSQTTPTTSTTPQDSITTSRSRGRPRRPTAQKSVHQLVLNLTQSSEKKSPNVNKRQKTNSTENDVSTTVTTTVVTTTATPKTTTTTPPITATATTSTATPSTTISSVAKDLINDWKIGQKVEAQDVAGDWYSAKIVALNEDNSQVLVHFERWSSRYDQWFSRNSPLIREKTSSESSNASSEPEFSLHEEVLARWTDNRPYPATIVEVYFQQKSVLVLFFDGYRKKVKFSQIEKMPKEFTGLRVPAIKTGFEIKADHNDFKCHFDNCGKGFRKQSLLTQHLKHYHKSDDKSVVKTTEETTEERILTEVSPIVSQKTPIVAKPISIEKSVPKEETSETSKVSSKVSPKMSPKVSSVVSTSRLKRKYVRKPLPSTAVRKSNRQSSIQNDFSPLLTTITTTRETIKETPIVTPNTTLPFWDARTVAEIHEADPEELVNCVCDAREESGLMVQCECCLCWQHANCMNFDGELDVPKDGYFCLSCRFPKNVRKSSKNAFLVNYALKSGKRPEFSFTSSDLSSNELFCKTNQFLSQLLNTKEVLSSLQTKLNSNEIIEKQSNIWRQLSIIEEKINEFEEINGNSNSNQELNESKIKNEISLMFSDLKNASILT